MSKKTQKEIPADMWLHVATDALARYSASADSETIGVQFSENGMMIVITGIQANDPRLAPAFLEVINAAVKMEQEPAP